MAKLMTWTNATAWTDGAAFGQAQSAGYQISLDGSPAVSVPVAWATSFDLEQLAGYAALPPGAHTASIAHVTTGGVVGNSSPPVTFQKPVPRPLAPTSVAVA